MQNTQGDVKLSNAVKTRGARTAILLRTETRFKQQNGCFVLIIWPMFVHLSKKGPPQPPGLQYRGSRAQ
eukprot:10841027-Lingulodinium_polyedra.AAC.1